MAVVANRIDVDVNKLDYELKKRGLNWRSASVKLGYGTTAMQNVKERGFISKPMATLLSTVLDIPEESYIIKSAELENEQTTESVASGKTADEINEELKLLQEISNSLEDISVSSKKIFETMYALLLIKGRS